MVEPEEGPKTLRLRPEHASGGVAGRVDLGFTRFFLQTGIALSPDTGFMIASGAGLVLCGIVLVVRDDFLEAALALGAGVLVVMAYYYHRRSRRIAEIREQLPDVMELLARAVRAGESLDQAISLVGESAPRPLGPEFKRCARQLEMGLSVSAAMEAITLRAPVTELRIMASALMIQRRAGGSLPRTLERLSAVVRDRLSYQRQFKAATGASRISTMLIGLTGPLVTIYLLIWQREYFDKFFESFPGQMMLLTAIVLQVIGYFWIYQLLKNEY
jgi:tight adherence protein B